MKKGFFLFIVQFLFWEGKYYDATKVYVFRPELSNYLKVSVMWGCKSF